MTERILICLLLAFSNNLWSQLNNSFLPFLQNEASLTSYEEDFSDYVITNTHTSKRSNVTHYYLNQRFGAIEIKNAVMSIHIAKDGSLLTLNNQFITNLKNSIGIQKPSINQNQALVSISQKMGYDMSILPVIVDSKDEPNQFVLFSKGSISQELIPVKLLYQPMSNGSIKLAWDLSIMEINSPNWYSFRIDAVTGELLDQENWTLTCNFGNEHNHSNDCKNNYKISHETESGQRYNRSILMPSAYNVLPIGTESPNHGPRLIVTDPHDLVASPFGWHDFDGIAGAEYEYTKGNNVEAKDDIAGDNESTIGQFANGGSNLNFDFPLNLNQSPSQNLNAALTNLFYWNNVMHDVWYNYGFDEAAGNFQQNNYGNGGNATDFVRADGLDGSGTNNANFSTPTDGNKPRMQMYLWSAPSSSLSVVVNSPPAIVGSYSGVKASFGASNYNVTGDLVLADPILACSSLLNGSSINGKIAVIDRGTCEFGDKCLNAQNAGAIAVIVCNNVSSAPISMGAGSNGGNVSIPCIMLSQANCNTIKLQITNTVNITLIGSGGIQLDGDFDNGIVAHEYGHGISTRLTGGAGNSSCLNNDEQMGEGWSDWFGLMLTMKTGDSGLQGKGIGTYALGQPITGVGIRQYKYSTDLAVNPHTYNSIKTVAIPHGIGSVWSAMLWDMSWLLIDAYGFDPDYYHGSGGNNIAMALVVEALKLQPCSPGFVDGRNAILQADNMLYGGIHNCLIWKAFARRGLGFSASQGASSSRSDGTQAFDMPTNCCNQVYITDNSGVGSLRDAISCSVNGDTLHFAPFLNDKLIQLVGGIAINKNLFIRCTNLDPIRIGTTGNATTIIINANNIVEMENVKIIGSTNVIARVLINNGSLTCRDVTFVDPLMTSNPNSSILNNGTLNLAENCSLLSTIQN